MISIPDQVQRIRTLLKGRLDKVMIATMGLLFVLTGLLVFTESRSAGPLLPDPKPQDPKADIEIQGAKSEPYNKIKEMIAPPTPFDASDYAVLSVFNMFDPKSAKDNEQLEKEADELVKQAQVAFSQGNLTEATDKANQALRIHRINKSARALIEEIEKKTKSAEPAKPDAAKAPAPAPAPAAAKP